MELYKLKHKPTGLYYQPIKGKYSGVTNLSKRGKIYQTSSNALIGNGDDIVISITYRQYEAFKELFDSLGACKYYRRYTLRCKKTDFEIEYIR